MTTARARMRGLDWPFSLFSTPVRNANIGYILGSLIESWHLLDGILEPSREWNTLPKPAAYLWDRLVGQEPKKCGILISRDTFIGRDLP